MSTPNQTLVASETAMDAAPNPAPGTPFADCALELQERGLAVMPTGGDDGKKPLIKGFNKWRNPPSRAAIEEWSVRHPGANIAVLTGLSRVIIVDIDDPALLPAMLERFGETPLIVKTPRPGFQLWYSDPGSGDTLPSNLLRQSEGLSVDIKSGKSGIVIVPPSFNPKHGRHYEFHRGGWDEMASLPPFPLDKLDIPVIGRGQRHEPQRQQRIVGAPSTEMGGYREGTRNPSLFVEALRRAPLCDDADELAADLSRINAAKCRPPLARNEVQRIADSAMRIEDNGTNFVGGSGGTVIPHDVVDDIARVAGKDCAAALLTWLILKRNHSHHDEPFAFSPAAMASKEVIPGIRNRRALERARDALMEAGLLIKAGEKPGRNGHSCPLYRLAQTARVKTLH